MLEKYYDRRAQEYEEIYRRDDPVRQSELGAIAEAVKQALSGRRVLELACGTGYWTEIVAEVAQHIVAIDASPQMLDIARQKGLPPEKVEFRQADVYALESVHGEFDAGLANFWLSHVPKARLHEMLRGFHEKLASGAVVFIADNVHVPGIGGEVITRPGGQDTFKLRELSNGSRYEIIKNYYSADQLRTILEPVATNLEMHFGKCFWSVRYVIN